MTDYDRENFDGETNSDDNPDKEARYQELCGWYESSLEVFSDKELLDQLEFYMKEFIALGDYKDSAEKAEECSIKRREIQKELQEELQREMAKVPPKPEESAFGKKCRELKSQIAALTETVKKDEEKIAALNNKLSGIKTGDLEKALKRRRFQAASPYMLIPGIILIIIEFVLISSKRMEIILLGIFCGLVGLVLLVVWIAIYIHQAKNNSGQAEQALAQKRNLSSSLDTAKKEAEKHKAELESKQREYDRYILEL